ncbi:MAG: hypothetical protein K6F61_05215 [Clostridiales bacterium]|nr:hypothetical protein [Clostridiales bacterium]
MLVIITANWGPEFACKTGTILINPDSIVYVRGSSKRSGLIIGLQNGQQLGVRNYDCIAEAAEKSPVMKEFYEEWKANLVNEERWCEL